MKNEIPAFVIILSGCIFVWLSLWVGHYFKWEQWLGREMHRLEAYVYGTSTIFLTFLAIAFFLDLLYSAWILASLIVTAGISTFLAWIIDHQGLKMSITRRLTKYGKSHEE